MAADVAFRRELEMSFMVSVTFLRSLPLRSLPFLDENSLAAPFATLVAVGEQEESLPTGHLVPEQTTAQPHESDSNDRNALDPSS